MKKITTLVLAAIMLIVCLAPISSIIPQANSTENVPTSSAEHLIEISEGATIDDATIQDGKVTFKVTLPQNGYAQFMQKVDVTSLKATVLIGENSTSDYQNTDMYMQLTTSTDISKDISPTGTDGLTWRFYGSSSSVVIGKNKATSNTYRSGLSNIVNDKGIIITFNKNNSGNVIPKAPLNVGMTELPSDNSLTSINGLNGVYFRLRHDDDNDRTVSYTVTLESPDIKSDIEYYDATDFIKYVDGATLYEDSVFVEDGNATFKIKLPANGYAQFNQKLTDLIGGGATVNIQIGSNSDDDYTSANMQVQLTANPDTTTDIEPVDEYRNADPGVEGMTWLFYGNSDRLWTGRGVNTSGGGTYSKPATDVPGLGGINIVFDLDSDSKVTYASTDTLDGFNNNLPSTKTLEQIGGTNGVYFRLRSVIEQTYTVTIKSNDIKKNIIKELSDRYQNNFAPEIADYLKMSNGATVNYDNSYVEDGFAYINVTLPAGGYVQFMQKVNITDNTASSLNAAVKVNNNTTADYNTSDNTNFYMQLTPSSDISTDIVPVNEKNGVDPGTKGMTWRFYSAGSYIAIGQGSNTNNNCSYVSDVVSKNKGINMAFVKDASDIVYPKALDKSDMTDQPSKYKLTDILSDNSVYFRLRSEYAQTYTIILKSSDIKVNKTSKSEFIKLSKGAVIDNDSVSIQDGKATFKVTLPQKGYAQFMQKVDVTSLKTTVTIGDNTTTDYQNTDMYMQLTTLNDTSTDIDPTGTDGLTWRFYGSSSSVVIGKNKATSNTYRSGLSNIVNDKGIIITFNENTDGNIIPKAPKNSDMSELPSDNTLSSINGNDGVYFRLRNDDDNDRTVTYTVTLESPEIVSTYTKESDFIKYVDGVTLHEDSVFIEEGKATFKVTVPANGYVQFMQKLSVTRYTNSTLKATVTVGDNSAALYKDSSYLNFNMQLTSLNDMSVDINPTNETNGLSWRFYGAGSYAAFGLGGTVDSTYSKDFTAIVNQKGININFNKNSNGTVSPKYDGNTGMSDKPSASTLTQISGDDGVYFRLRSYVAQTYIITLESPDIIDPESVESYNFKYSNGSTPDNDFTHVKEGKATFKVTLPANGYAQFMQRLTLTDDTASSIKVAVKVNNNTTADYNTSSNTNFYMQLTPSLDMSTDIVPVNEKNGVDPGKLGMTWRFYSATSYIAIGQGSNTNNNCGTVSDIVTNNKGINMAFVKDADDIVYPKALDKSDMTDQPSKYNLTDISGVDGVYFRLRSEVAQTYIVTIESPDIKDNIFDYIKIVVPEKDRYSFSDDESYLISSNHKVENGIVTDEFSFKLNGLGSNIQLDEKLTTLIDGGFAKVYLGDNKSADYAATNFNMQLTSRPNDLLSDPVDENEWQTDPRTISFSFSLAVDGIRMAVNKGANATGAGSSTYIPNYANTPGVDGINLYFKTNKTTGTLDVSRVSPLNNYDFTKTSSHTIADADLTDGAYFRLRHAGSTPQVYTVVLTYPESKDIEHNLSDTAYTVTDEKVVNADNTAETYEKGKTITKAGHYVVTSTVNKGTVTKDIYLYKTGDINGDNSANILDLFIAAQNTRFNNLSDVGSLGIKAIDKYSYQNAYTNLRKELLGLDYEVPEYTDYKPVTLNVEDFGAVGDGVTDDGVAIYDALQALRQSAPGSVLEFEAKTYRFVDNGKYSQITGGKKLNQAVFEFYGDKGLTIKGKTENGNTTLISIGGTSDYYKNYYANIENCEDIAFENINFDYAEYKAAFAVTSLNYRDGWLQASINGTKNILTGYLVKDSNGNYPDIHLEDGDEYKANGNAQFGVLNKENNRYFMYFTSFKMVDKTTGEIEITLNKDNDNTMSNLKDGFFSEIADFILPMPYSGNLIERGFSVHGVNNFTMKDCKVFSASRHGMSLQNNSGDITFDNVDVVPSDDKLNFTSWGDFYHVLNSTGANYTWKDCEARYNYDDVFNISAATLKLNKINSLREIEIGEGENGFGKVYAGTTLVIVDTATGELVYRDTIKRVIEQDDDSANIRLSSSLPDGTTLDNKLVWIDEAVGTSTMQNCTFDGTFRARGNIAFNSCNFTVKRFWIGLESVTREGPLSRNIVFNNCSLTCQNVDVFEIGSYNEGSNATASNAYKLENIKFSGCTWKNGSGTATSYSSFIKMFGNSADEVIHE